MQPFAACVLIAAVVAAAAGCTSGGEPVDLMMLERPEAELLSPLDGPACDGEYDARSGVVVVRIGDGAAHTVQVELRTRTGSGDPATVLTVEDTTAGTSMTLTLDGDGDQAVTAESLVAAILTLESTAVPEGIREILADGIIIDQRQQRPPRDEEP